MNSSLACIGILVKSNISKKMLNEFFKWSIKPYITCLFRACRSM